MNRRCALFFVTLCVFLSYTSANADASGKKAGVFWHSVTVQGKTIRFPVFVPEVVDSQTRLPLVLLTHSETGKATDRILKKNGWTDTASRVGFIVAAIGPDCATPDVLSAVLKTIGEKYPLDMDNRYAVRTNGIAAPQWSLLAPDLSAQGIVTFAAKTGSDSRALWNTLERLSPPSGIAASTTTRLTIRITGLRSDSGKMSLLLFNAADGFPNDSRKAIAQQTVSIKNKSVAVAFEKLPRGDYAAVLLHDENSNGKLDTSFGFPQEGFGTSNNPKVRFGPPSFKDARFFLSGKGAKRTIVIRMVYL